MREVIDILVLGLLIFLLLVGVNVDKLILSMFLFRDVLRINVRKFFSCNGLVCKKYNIL